MFERLRGTPVLECTPRIKSPKNSSNFCSPPSDPTVKGTSSRFRIFKTEREKNSVAVPTTLEFASIKRSELQREPHWGGGGGGEAVIIWRPFFFTWSRGPCYRVINPLPLQLSHHICNLEQINQYLMFYQICVRNSSSMSQPIRRSLLLFTQFHVTRELTSRLKKRITIKIRRRL